MTTALAGPRNVPSEDLDAFCVCILRKLGASDEHAARVARALVQSNLAGHDSHGVLLLPYYEDLIKSGDILPSANPEVIADLTTISVIDGHRAFGQVVGQKAVELAVERGQSHGVAVVSGRNAAHLGRLGEYTEVVAQAGLIGILLVNFQGGDQRVVPHGGIDRRLTNNPISLSVPGPDGPIVLDMALSVIAEAKVWLAKARGTHVPDGSIVDSEGRPTSDPDDFLRGGALLPLGGLQAGYKGFGLIVLVELIVGALSGGGICSNSTSRFSNAFVMLAIDPHNVSDGNGYLEEVSEFIAHIKATRPRTDVSNILLPGEPERLARQARSHSGIPVEASTFSVLADLASRLGVASL